MLGTILTLFGDALESLIDTGTGNFADGQASQNIIYFLLQALPLRFAPDADKHPQSQPNSEMNSARALF